MDIYEEKAIKLRNENRKKFFDEINTKKTKEKIEKYAKKYNYDVDYLYNLIFENSFLVNSLQKETSRQNFHEDVAIEYIQNNFKCIKNIKKLPKDNKNSKYIINGLIMGQEVKESTDNHTKSIDFYWEYKEFKFYATHKYTKQSGGAQDNQYKDVILFLEHAKQSKKANIIFVAICDGDYYKKGEKIEYLRENTKNTNCFVTDIYNLEENMMKFLNKSNK